jgi:hypothetical protein
MNSTLKHPHVVEVGLFLLILDILIVLHILIMVFLPFQSIFYVSDLFDNSKIHLLIVHSSMPMTWKIASLGLKLDIHHNSKIHLCICCHWGYILLHILQRSNKEVIANMLSRRFQSTDIF